jgi:hypothetical protein
MRLGNGSLNTRDEAGYITRRQCLAVAGAALVAGPFARADDLPSTSGVSTAWLGIVPTAGPTCLSALRDRQVRLLIQARSAKLYALEFVA